MWVFLLRTYPQGLFQPVAVAVIDLLHFIGMNPYCLKNLRNINHAMAAFKSTKMIPAIFAVLDATKNKATLGSNNTISPCPGNHAGIVKASIIASNTRAIAADLCL